MNKRWLEIEPGCDEHLHAIDRLMHTSLNASVSSTSVLFEAVVSWAYLKYGAPEETVPSNTLAPLIDQDELSDDELCQLSQHIVTKIGEKSIRHDLMVGRIIVENARRFIMSNATITKISISEIQPCHERMKQILTKYSNKCNYERSGDTYMHDLLRSKLNPSLNAILLPGHTPYEFIASEYNDDANDLVRPHIEMAPSTKCGNINWDDNGDVDAFHFCVGLLREMIDGLDCKIFTNASISRNLKTNVPHFFSTTRTFDLGGGKAYGVVFSGTIFFSSNELPILTTLVHYVQACHEAGFPAVMDLYTALFSPESLPASSPFNTYLDIVQD